MLTESQNKILRRKFSALTAPNGTFKRIALVGAYLTKGSETGLYIPDENYLERALVALKELGQPVQTDFDVDAVNINEEFGGQDYLSPEFNTQADLSIFCFIRRTFKQEKASKERCIASSPYEIRQRHPWLKSAIRHKSKAIITFGSEWDEAARDVSAKDFEGSWLLKSPYQKIVSAKIQAMEGDALFASGFIQRHFGCEERMDVLFHKDLT